MTSIKLFNEAYNEMVMADRLDVYGRELLGLPSGSPHPLTDTDRTACQQLINSGEAVNVAEGYPVAKWPGLVHCAKLSATRKLAHDEPPATKPEERKH